MKTSAPRFFPRIPAYSHACLLTARTKTRSPRRQKRISLLSSARTPQKRKAKGFTRFRYDASSGKLTALGVAAETPDPSFVAIHPTGKYLYAVNESGKSSKVTSFALDAKTGKLTQLNQVLRSARIPVTSRSTRPANTFSSRITTSGTLVVFRFLTDGKIGEKTALIQDNGTLGRTKSGRKVLTRIGLKPARTIISRSRRIWVSMKF